MPTIIRSGLTIVGLLAALAGRLPAQQTEAETQRATLIGLRKFAVYARVQLSPTATLQRIDESLLRSRIEAALRREGISIDGRADVRDGSQASLDLLYMVMETSNKKSQAIFAASSCLQASQMVRIPRLTTAKHIAYAVVSTWRSCGLLVGDKGAYGATILQNADEQIARFLEAWRLVNLPRPAPPPAATPELGFGVGSSEYTSPRSHGSTLSVPKLLGQTPHFVTSHLSLPSDLYGPTTATGVWRSWVVPSPSSPNGLSPQQ